MRKKIKELMNREEGFTLVELLAVIVILGIILAIAIPSIGGVINNARTQATAAETELVNDAARLYFIEKDTEPSVTVDVLITGGYLSGRSEEDVTRLKAAFTTPILREDVPGAPNVTSTGV